MSRKKYTIDNKLGLGKRIRDVRTHIGSNQTEFSANLNTSYSYLSDVERGKSMPGADMLIMLRHKFQVNINWLLTGIGDMFEISEAEQSNECPNAVPLKKVKTTPLCYNDPVCKRICDICTTLNEPSKRAILKMMEGLQSEPDFRKRSGEDRRKKA